MFWATALTDVAAAQAAMQLLYLAFVLFGGRRAAMTDRDTSYRSISSGNHTLLAEYEAPAVEPLSGDSVRTQARLSAGCDDQARSNASDGVRSQPVSSSL